MKENVNFKVRFFARKSRGKNSSNFLLLVRVTVNSRRVEISLKKELPVALWDEKMQALKGRSSKATSFNDYLEKVKSKFNLIEQQLLFENKRPTADLVKARYNGEPDPDEIPNPKLLELYDEHNRKFKELLGSKKHSDETYKRHKVSRNHAYSFIAKAYKIEDIPFEEVNYKFLNEYEHYLKTVRKCNHNSSMKYIRNLGKIINQAHAEGYLEKNPFGKYKMSFERVIKDPLTDNEINRLIALNVDERLEKIRDFFVFGIYTGLPFVDLEKLTMDDIYEDKEGKLWIKKNRNKTELEFLVPVLPIPKRLIQKYKDHPLRQKCNLVFPIPTNQKYNAYLKELATLAKIKKILTTHLARHTFATTITLEKGIPIEIVSKMLGHGSIRTTQIYAQVKERAIRNSMEKLMNDDNEVQDKPENSQKDNKKGGKND